MLSRSRRKLLALAAVALLALAPNAGSSPACRDFYAVVNEPWQNAHRPPPGAYSVDRFDFAAAAYEDRIHAVLESAAAASGPATSLRGTVGSLYASCMDEAARERTGPATLHEELRRVADVVDRVTLSAELARLHDRGVDALFVLAPGVDPSGRGRFVAEIAPVDVPPAELALQDGATPGVRAREAAYLRYGRSLFELAGDDPRRAISEAHAAFRFQDELLAEGSSGVSATRVRSGRHTLRVGTLAVDPGAIDWTLYFQQRGLSWIKTVNETVPGYMARADIVLRTMPASSLRSYLRWRLLDGYARYLSRRFVATRADFESAVNGATATEPAWKRCTEQTSELLPAEVAALGLDDPVAARTDRRAGEVIAGVRRAMRGMIRDATWLSPPTRRRIEAKLDALRIIHALPASSIRFEPLALDRSGYLRNVQLVALLNTRLRFRALREEFDQAALTDSPLSQEIAYLLDLNEVLIPPTVVQWPFVSEDRDAARDYGGLGVLVAHEFMHSLDESGRTFDETGRVRSWWTKSELAAYRKRVACIARQFGGYRLPGGTRVDGQLVRDEAIADLGGMEIAFRAYRTERRTDGSSEGLPASDRRFFIAYAQSQVETTQPDDDLVERLDEHAPEHLRINGTLADMSAFERTFACRSAKTAPDVTPHCRFW